MRRHYTDYRFRFRGNTVVEVQQRSEEEGYPLYLRDALNQSQKAPLTTRGSYVARKWL